MPLNVAALVTSARTIAAGYRVGFDNYQIMRGTSRVADGAGGYTETPTVWENGYAILTTGTTRPEEKIIADRAGSQMPYTLRNITHLTQMVATDTLQIGTRVFEVLGVLRAESIGAVVTAVLEERS